MEKQVNTLIEESAFAAAKGEKGAVDALVKVGTPLHLPSSDSTPACCIARCTGF